MPPQPGMFPIHSHSTAHKSRVADPYGGVQDLSGGYHHNAVAGPSSRVHGFPMDEGKKDRKRKEIAGKLTKEMSDRRDDGRHFTESISALQNTFVQLSTRPETSPAHALRLYPISIERSALLASISLEEKANLAAVQMAYEDEREKVEEEWKKGRERIRERLFEGIEERRKRAREEKDGENIGDASLDSQSRPHITRKLRNKAAGSATTHHTSPPGTPSSHPHNGSQQPLNSTATANALTALALTNPHSLSVDELPSPFPLPLTSTQAQSSGTSGGHGNRRRAGGARGGDSGLKSLAIFDSDAMCRRDAGEIEVDLMEIRKVRGRRRGGAGR